MRGHRLRTELRSFFFLRSQIKDDRGRWRAAPAFGGSPGGRASLAGLDPETRFAIRYAYEERCTRRGAAWLRPISWLRLAAYLFVGGIIAASIASTTGRLVVIVIIVVLILWDIRTRQSLSWTDLMILRDQMLAHRVCPHCAYPLDDAQVEEDGCSVCSECAGAWRLPLPLP